MSLSVSGAAELVTPSWYEIKCETGKVVPTWNYALTQHKEEECLTSSKVADAPDAYIASQMKWIVGIEIER